MTAPPAQPKSEPELARCSARNAEGVVCGGEAYESNPDTDRSKYINCMACGFTMADDNGSDIRRLWNRAHGESAVERVLEMREVLFTTDPTRSSATYVECRTLTSPVSKHISRSFYGPTPESAAQAALAALAGLEGEQG